MKTKLHQYALLGILLLSTCAAREAGDSAFPEVGKFFAVEYSGPTVIADKSVYYGGSIPSGATVQILRHSGGTWALVEYLHPLYAGENSKKPRFRREHIWLNFANLLTAREMKKEDAMPKDAIIDD